METIIRITILYWFILFVIRVVPRRVGSITTPFEYVLVFLQGGVAIGVIMISDHSLVNALLGISTLALNHTGVSLLKQKSKWWGRIFDGTPSLVLENGNWRKERMDKLLIQPQDVLTAARLNQIQSEEEIHMAVWERSGEFSVFEKKKQDRDAAKPQTSEETPKR